MSILGNRVLRKEDPKFLTAGGTYVDDIKIAGCAYVTYVRSPTAHARITAIDVSDAAAAPGVLAVFTGADVDLAPMEPPMGMYNAGMSQPFLATGTVRFVGECVAAVVSETAVAGVDAAELVFVDYEPLTALTDVETASAGETLLFPDVGTNVAFELSFGRSDDFFDGCEVVVRQRIVNQRVAPCPLEVRAGAVVWGDDGRLTQYASTQSPHGFRDSVAKALGLELSQVHLIAPDVGGGFGAKINGYTEEILLGWLAKQVGRPVKWTETRSESMVGLGHGRGQTQDVELGGTKDGMLKAYRLTVLQDAGAYPNLGGLLPFMTRTMASGVYEIAKVEFNAKSLVTSTTPTVAYRGAGRPEAAAALERIMDIYATEIGVDPAEVRRRNLIPAESFPYTTQTGTVYDCGDYARALDLVLEAAGYGELRAEQQQRRQAGDTVQMGIGLSIYVEITGAGGMTEFGSLEVLPNGRALVRTGTSPHGQGHVTSWAMLASEQTGIPIEDIDVIHGDTDIVPSGGGTSGSRSLQQGGVAVNRATTALVERAHLLAAELLEANPDDVVLDKVDGRFHVAGSPASAKSWAELATAAADGPNGGIAAEIDVTASSPTFPFGAHIAVVDIDIETGKVSVRRMIAVDDAGRILNPMLVEGQVHGGLAQGVAQALLEGMTYDDDGNPTTSNLADYTFISAAELPSFETVRMETPTPVNELGAKGIGESGTIGSTPAVQNAVVDALSHLGVRHIEMPATPERIWRAIAEATRGQV